MNGRTLECVTHSVAFDDQGSDQEQQFINLV